jgi:hypothetical protein
MAASAQPNRKSPPSSRPKDNTSRRRALPSGPCNYRDLSTGPKPPECGCRRFWWTGEAYTAQEEENVQHDTPWCVCGHHACFHDFVERFARGHAISQQSISPSMAPPRVGPAIAGLTNRQQDINGGRNTAQSLSGSARPGLRGLDDIQPVSTFSTPGRISALHTQDIGKKREIQQHGNQVATGDEQGKTNTVPSEVSTSCVPRIPSMYLLNSSELRPWSGYEAQASTHAHDPNRHEGAGFYSGRYDALGLMIQDGAQGGRHASPSPTVADAASVNADVPANESQLVVPSTREASSGDSVRNISPDTGFMQRVLASRHVQSLDVNFPRHFNMFEDLIQSATEVATPSINNTPDFRRLEQVVQETQGLVNTIVDGNGTAPVNSRNSANAAATVTTQPAQAFPEPFSLLTSPLESVQEAMKKIPLTLQQLTPLLTSLQDYLARNPDISIHESINSLTRRMECLENSSFNIIPPEQLQDQFENFDGRLIELDNRVDDHDRMLVAFDPDNEGPVRRLRAVKENTSFGSNRSLASGSSSALISAAIDRVETEGRLKAVEERIDSLEKLQLPSLALPWEIEVVLLPWGREMKGMWYPPTELIKPGMTQDSDPWTQGRSARSMSRNSMSLGAEDSVWSDQAIHNWADNAEDWLSPKACGTNGVIYHRLRSRGLVKQITLTSPGAHDTRESISKAFGDLLGTISGKHGQGKTTQSSEEQAQEDSLLGLNAPFIPLRKIHRSSRLRFLTPDEMVTPALWTAEFLASGVFMRAPGGQKRLFITTRNAYLQPSDEDVPSWTWQRLRLLARMPAPDEDAQAEGVPEADAREPCWAYHPSLDVPPSVHSSFASHTSHVSNSFAQESVQEVPREMQGVESSSQSEESEADSEDPIAAVQPITPTSEFPTQRSMLQRGTRTTSNPLTEASYSAPQPNTQLHPSRILQHPQISKRRISSFSHSSNPLIATLPTFIPSPSKSRSRLSKRPRLTRSRSRSASAEVNDSVESSQHSVTSLDPNIDPTVVLSHLRERVPSGEAIMPIWAFTPRRSKEPHSPFLVEGSDTGVGASQSTTNRERVVSGGRVDKRGRNITPSAYATPFSGTAFVSGNAEADSADEGDNWEGVKEVAQDVKVDVLADEDESMDDDSFDGEDADSGLSDDESAESAEHEGGEEEEEDDDMSSVDELHWEGE